MNRPSLSIALVLALSALVLQAWTFPVEGGGPESGGQQALPVPLSVRPEVIQVPEVAKRATEIAIFLRGLRTQLLVPNATVIEIQQQIGNLEEQVEQDLAATTGRLEEHPTLIALQGEEQLWERTQRRTTQWLNLLTLRCKQLQEAQARLADLHDTWAKTRDAAAPDHTPRQIYQEIEEILEDIEATLSPLRAILGAELELQGRVASLVVRCGVVLTHIDQAQQEVVSQLLVRDGLPVWSAELWQTARATLPERTDRVFSLFWSDLKAYVTHPDKGLSLHICSFLVLATFFGIVGKHAASWSRAEGSRLGYTAVFLCPYSAALLLPLVFGAGPISQVPPMVRQFFMVLSLFPMIRLMRRILPSCAASVLTTLGVLFAFNTLRQLIGGDLFLEQTLVLVEALGGLVLLGCWAVRDRFRCAGSSHDAQLRPALFMTAHRLLLGVFAGALAAASAGYQSLARMLTSSFLVLIVQAMVMYCYVLMASALVALLLHVRPFRLLGMVQNHRDMLEGRIHRVLVLFMAINWVIRSLDYIGLLDPAWLLLQNVLFARLEKGSVSISLWDLVSFGLTVWAAYLISAFIRFSLDEDIYPRIQIDEGRSYALSSLLHYFILGVGIAAGLAMLGMDLNKVTVLAGALGVGIGFGLQNVVNNFVSGLILLFERPVHVGDTIEVGSLLGEVRHVGIRVSKVRTRQGADIIVPNAHLTSERLTNWTLSDRKLRIDLPVGLNYGASPRKAVEVLEKVALTHPDILSRPRPRALLKAYGDSSINFELRAWTTEIVQSARVRSELAIALYDAVIEAGMQFPFPQREVRLLGTIPKLADEVANPTGQLYATSGTGIRDFPADREPER